MREFDNANESHRRTTRTTALMAVFFAILMLGVPSFFVGGGFGSTANAAAADGVDVDRQFVIGVSGELSISTLNPNTYTMMAEAMVLFPCYSGLLQYSVDSQLMGDLAYEWSSTPDGLTWYFKIHDNVYFCDPSEPEVIHEDRHLTAEDVIWSLQMYNDNAKSRLHPSLPGVIESMGLVDEDDPYHLFITLNGPYAPFLGAMSLPILPKYYWEDEDPQNFDNSPPIGSGPFYYASEGIPETGSAVLKANPIWFLTEENGWKGHVDTVTIIEELNEGTAWTDLQNGAIDVQLNMPVTLYVPELLEGSTPYVTGFSQSQGFVYEFNLNQMSDDLRKELGGSFNAGENNQLLLDWTVKRAIAQCIDKEYFVSDVLQGLGSVATSLVPECNPWLYVYGTRGEEVIPFDIENATERLYNAGWRYDSSGTLYEIESGDPPPVPLCKVGGTDPLSFNFCSPDTGTTWRYASNMIVNWTAAAGIELDYEEKTINEMNTIWYSGDYDIWLWDWVFGPLNEPDTDCLSVLTSMAVGVDSDVYWVNEEFDALYNQSIVEMDPLERYEIVVKMQQIAYEDMGCQCIAYRDDLYGFSTRHWMNFGDINNTYMLLPDNTMQYLSMQMSPIENEAPTITGGTWAVEGNVGESTEFSMSAEDDYPLTDLEVRWFWGDGEKSSWTPLGTGSGSANGYHTYDRDGVYTAYVAVRENSTSNDIGVFDGFYTWKAISVTVADMSNDAPVIESITVTHDFLPDQPDSATNISFLVVASDDENDPLFINWDFGDGHVMAGAEAWHQYTEEDPETGWTFEFTVSVTDNRIGAGTRPVQDGDVILVRENQPPTLTVPPFANRLPKQVYTYTVAVSDADSRDDLLVTWDWGDGSPLTVTEVAAGGTCSSANHAYNSWGTYELTVWVDDMSGVDGHNVSESNSIVVVRSNEAPVIISYDVSETNPFTGQEVTFTAYAEDPDGDGLRLTFAFGDGTYAVENFAATPDIVTAVVTHSYSEADTYLTTVSVSDGLANESSSSVSITVESNVAPVFLEDLETVYASTGVPVTIDVEAFDSDEDDLTYTWVWGDGDDDVTTDPTATHTYDESSTIAEPYEYSVTLDDGCGHEVTQSADLIANWIPVLTARPDRTVIIDEERTYTAVATDNDLDDTLTYMWDFDDGTDYQFGSSVLHTYTVEDSYDVTVWVWDGFEMHLASHNVSDTNIVTVIAWAQYAPTVEPLPELTVTVDVPVTFAAVADDANVEDILIYTWNFGDTADLYFGDESPSMVYTYTTAGDYVYTVWVDDQSGVVDHNVSVSQDIHVIENLPPTAVAGEDDTVPQGTTVTFDGSDSYDDVDDVEDLVFTWTFEDGGSQELTGMEPEYTFDNAGVFVVTLVVEDLDGLVSDPDTVTITVTDTTPPTAVAGDDIYVDMGATVDFDGSGSSDNLDATEDLEYSWLFYDGTTQTLTGMTPSYQFDNPGEFSVLLTVTDAEGNEASDTVTVFVADTVDPVAVADADETSVGTGDTVTFDGSGSSDNSGSIASYEWTFEEDGETVTLYGEMPTHEFLIPGTYVVTLEVSDSDGNTDTDTVTITVVDDDDPVAVADADLTSVDEGDAVTFDGSGSSDNVGIVEYVWTFTVDSTPVELTGVSAEYTFDVAGTYEVTLTVTDAEGNSGTDSVTIEVASTAVNEAPVADAGADQVVEVGSTVTFDGSDSSDDAAIDTYTWTFTYDSAPETLTGESPTFVFDIAGEYEVTLTVEDGEGLTDSDTMTVTVGTAPVADAGADQTVDVGDTVTFDGSGSTDSDGTIVSYTWTFVYQSSARTLTGVSPTFDFDVAGTYTVTLTIVDDIGLTSTDTVQITVEGDELDGDDDEKSFIESYGLALGILAALVVVALVAFFLMKKGKGGKPEAAEPEAPVEGGQEL
jgi:PKD repeat protein/ABC-type oligopeptide transport system substrate-binding subunit